MKIGDIAPTLENFEVRLAALEATQHTHEAEEAPTAGAPFRPDARKESGNAAPAPQAHEDLKATIQADLKEYGADVIGQALLHQVIAPRENRKQCRENVMVVESGETVSVQPFRFTDAVYKVVSRDMLDRILKETKVDAIEWQSEDYDCEDIARKFVTRCCDLGINSVGRVMAWSGGHAFCIAIVQDGASVDFVFIEPQTDEIVTDFTGMYDISDALIVIA